MLERKKGSKKIAELIRAGEQLWFVAASGIDLIEYEVLFMCLQSDSQFFGNVRPEGERSVARQLAAIRASMWARVEVARFGGAGWGQLSHAAPLRGRASCGR